MQLRPRALATTAQQLNGVAELFPLDSAGALTLMTAMVRAGDRASALQHAQIHATLLRQALGIDPDPAVQELAAQLKETTGWELPNAHSGHRPSSPHSGVVANNPVGAEARVPRAADVRPLVDLGRGGVGSDVFPDRRGH